MLFRSPPGRKDLRLSGCDVITKAQFIAKGREFLYTPHVHQGRLKGIALDCVGLVLCTCEELVLKDRLGAPIRGADYIAYPHQPTTPFVHEEFQRRAIEKPIGEARAGDVVTIAFPSVPCHCAIVSEIGGLISVIHCYASVGKVVEHVLDMKWRRRIVGAFTLPGVIG